MLLRDLASTAVLLGVLIFVHELGHFLLAKLLNVKVMVFSLGFGPKLLGFKRGETEYQLAAVPLGGYVKMAGDDPNDLSPADQGRGFLEAAPWKRALIVGAGPAFSLAFPVIVFFFVFLGSHQVVSSKVGHVVEGFPAAKAGIRSGDRIVSIDGQKIRTFEEISAALKDRYDRNVRIEFERDGKVMGADLQPARDVIPDIVGTTQRGMIGISSAPVSPLLGVLPDSAAARAGLQTFDRVLRVNGTAVGSEAELFSVLAAEKGDTLEVSVLRSAPIAFPVGQLFEPQQVTLQVPRQTEATGYAILGAEASGLFVGTVLEGSSAGRAGLARGDRLLAIDDKPLESWNVFAHRVRLKNDKPFTLRFQNAAGVHDVSLQQEKLRLSDEMGTKTEALDLGLRQWASRYENWKADEVTVTLGPLEAMQTSLKRVPELIGQTAVAIGAMFTGQAPLDNLGSVFMIHDVASKSAAAGASAYLGLMALISINLGIINLLPIPILDGFGLLSAFWEAVRRRPIPARAREIANVVGLAMLLMLMGIAIKNDIVRMWGG